MPQRPWFAEKLARFAVMNAASPPIVLSLSGHDPTGGAGIQADIEMLFRLGCHPCTVITALTEQDTHDVRRIYPQDPAEFRAQALTLVDDLPPAVIKIGLLGSSALAVPVAEILDRFPHVPVVLDPVLAAGGGREFGCGELVTVLRDLLVPRCTVMTPNTHEARRLTDRHDLDQCAARLLSLGCRSVLITGTHDESEDVVNRLYAVSGMRCFHWSRLPETYHGSGCTLAAATAGFLARGLPVEEAVARAQAETWNSLQASHHPGRGQWLPDRGAGSTPRV